MALGEKLFEESGPVTSTKKYKGPSSRRHNDGGRFHGRYPCIGKFPSGKNMGSGTMTEYPHGLSDASFHGFVTTAEGEQFLWWAHEKTKMSQDGKSRGISWSAAVPIFQSYHG